MEKGEPFLGRILFIIMVDSFETFGKTFAHESVADRLETLPKPAAKARPFGGQKTNGDYTCE
ncbi:hypothetical protein AVO42_01530 [Thiomicrospira sp. XS5]|nr:hypothetical protein AVO42_01530 [Thiomicrospira sp. XS5]